MPRKTKKICPCGIGPDTHAHNKREPRVLARYTPLAKRLTPADYGASMTIPQVVREAYEDALARGFYSRPIYPPECAAILHGVIDRYLNEYNLLEDGIISKGYALGSDNRPVGPAVALADAFLMICHIFEHQQWDLHFVLRTKMLYNRRSPTAPAARTPGPRGKVK